jgi:hypothetical protein
MLTFGSGCFVTASRTLPCMYTVFCEGLAAGLSSFRGEIAYFGIFRRIKADTVTFLSHRVIFPEERPKDCTLCGNISRLCGLHIRDLIHEPGRSTCQLSAAHSTAASENDTYDSNPSTSQSNCPSLRLSVLIWPAQFTSETPAAHSSTVRSISRAKSWRCLISAGMTSRIRGEAPGPIASITLWVKRGL